MLQAALAVDAGDGVDVSDLLSRNRELVVVAPWAERACELSDELSDYVTFAWVVIGPGRIHETLLLYICHGSILSNSGNKSHLNWA